jgi:hypothetical protein
VGSWDADDVAREDGLAALHVAMDVDHLRTDRPDEDHDRNILNLAQRQLCSVTDIDAKRGITRTAAQMLYRNVDAIGELSDVLRDVHGIPDDVVQADLAAGVNRAIDLRALQDERIIRHTRRKKPAAGVTSRPRPTPPPNQIPLTFWRDFVTAPPSKTWIIRDVIAHGEVSSWIGKPGGGKSALMTDIAVHVALGQDWRGYRTRQRSGVVYFALERADLVGRRFQAHRLRDGLLDDLPIAVSGVVIDLIGPGCVGAIADAIKRAQDEFKREVGLAIIDTRSKGIAAGGGDEDKARFQNVAAANLRRVIERTGVHIASIGGTPARIQNAASAAAMPPLAMSMQR